MTATTTPPTVAPTRPVLEYDPAIDGLRGIAVAAVVAFHLGYLQGGFLGVDLFFTLSGYLITRLLLLEHAATGGVSLRAFWTRRAWRLLPVLYVLLAVLAVYAAFAARPDELAGIRGPGISSLAFVSNWWFIADGKGYWDLFTAPSPLEHVWSLSIEQQFYVVWPLLAVAILRGRQRTDRVARDHRPPRCSGSTVLLAVLARNDVSRAYFGSGARTSSILVGAALAIVVDRGDAWLHEGRTLACGAVDRSGRRRVDRFDLDHDQRRHRPLVLHRRILSARNRCRCNHRSAPQQPVECASTTARPATDPAARRHLLRRLPVALADDRAARQRSHWARRHHVVAGASRERRSCSRWGRISWSRSPLSAGSRGGGLRWSPSPSPQQRSAQRCGWPRSHRARRQCRHPSRPLRRSL